MPTAYPGANDTFGVPSSPATTPLASAGDSTRAHTQSHQDLGDAIVALQKNASPIAHDHSGTESRATQKLSQANTHQSADTDTADTALHHTIGAGQHQAAAGNHTHSDAATLATNLYGGAGRTQPYRCVIGYYADFTNPVSQDFWGSTAGNWRVFSDPDNMALLSPGSTGGAVGFARIKLPVAGWWEIEGHVLGDYGGAGMAAASIQFRTDNANPVIGDTIATDEVFPNGSANFYMNPRAHSYFPANSYIYTSTWGSVGWVMRGQKFNMRTLLQATYRGAVTS